MLQPPPSFQVPLRVISSAAQAMGLSERELDELVEGLELNKESLYPGSSETIDGNLFFTLMGRLQLLREHPLQNLKLGAKLQLSVMWPLNELFLNAPDLYSALSAPPELQALRVPFLRTRLSFEAGFFCVELVFFVDINEEQRRGLIEVYAQVMQSLAETYIGHTIPGCRLEFSYPKPAYYQNYDTFFKHKLSFDKPSNRFLIPQAYAKKSNPKANAQAFALAKSICLQQLKSVPNHSLTMVDRVCRTLMSKPMGNMNEDKVARALFVSKRTLARRLDQEGSSFRKVRDELLADLACRQLRESKASVESIGILLGYSDAANFRRAFKRWLGQSPSDYRQAFGRD